MEGYIKAFRFLSSQRGYGEVPQRISFSDMKSYAEMFGVWNLNEFVVCIIQMDSAYLEFKYNEIERERERDTLSREQP